VRKIEVGKVEESINIIKKTLLLIKMLPLAQHLNKKLLK
jgi:hypothetical protein